MNEPQLATAIANAIEAALKSRDAGEGSASTYDAAWDAAAQALNSNDWRSAS